MVDLPAIPTLHPIGAQVAPDVAGAALVDELRGYFWATFAAMSANKHRILLIGLIDESPEANTSIRGHQATAFSFAGRRMIRGVSQRVLWQWGHCAG